MAGLLRPPMRQEGNQVGAANTAVTITLAAPGAGNKHSLRGVHWSYDGTPTGGQLTIYENVTERVFDLDITTSGPGFWNLPGEGWETAQANHAVAITLAAGGAGVVGKLVAIWQTVRDEEA